MYVPFDLVFVSLAMCNKNKKYCSNGGQCKEDQMSVTCSCTERYSGATCEKFVGKLKAIVTAYIFVELLHFVSFTV